MIRVNLAGTAKKKAAKPGLKFALPNNAMPFILIGIVLATVGGGYWWYASLSASQADLQTKITAAQQQKAALDAVIKQDQIYEGRKKTLENRIRIIEDLQRNQVSPVISLDQLDDAIDKTQYVWLSQLDQNNAIFSMSGTATSVNAIADLVSNLQRTGYFHNINFLNATDSQGNFTFSLTCEFAPPKPAERGGN
jgi:Tfp pilus assembly protein PilN